MNELEAMHDLREEFRSSLDVVARELVKLKYELCANTDSAMQGMADITRQFYSLETIAVKLQSRLEQAEKDAKRYQWRKENPGVRIGRYKDKFRAETHDQVITDWLDTHDEAIDAAMQSAESK